MGHELGGMMLDSIYPNVIPGPPRPSSILIPQGFSRHHGQERHVVPGGGACLLQLSQGDRLTLVNDEGGQPVELVAAARDGRIDTAILGQAPNSTAEGLKALLASGEDKPESACARAWPGATSTWAAPARSVCSPPTHPPAPGPT
jgi:hypothetical protein